MFLACCYWLMTACTDSSRSDTQLTLIRRGDTQLTRDKLDVTINWVAISDRNTRAVFVNLLRSPGIDSQPGKLVRQSYLLYRPARLHRLAESISGLLKSLQIRAQAGQLFPAYTESTQSLRVSFESLGNDTQLKTELTSIDYSWPPSLKYQPHKYISC